VLARRGVPLRFHTPQEIIMRSTRIAVLFLAFAVSAAALAVAGPQAEKAAAKVQVVKLSFDDKGYVVTPSTVTRGVPVRMEVDLATVKGCMRTVVIEAFKVKQTVKEGATTVEFTPTRSGKIDVVCGMNMGKGWFTVVDPK
jgi:plastocyanin domain-containing protein